jgi:arylsulfatase
MLGTRGLWHDGWKVVTEHAPMPSDKGLFHSDADRSEAHDLSELHPEKVEELKALWFEAAKKYNVLPLNDMGCSTTCSKERPVHVLPRHAGSA